MTVSSPNPQRCERALMYGVACYSGSPVMMFMPRVVIYMTFSALHRPKHSLSLLSNVIPNSDMFSKNTFSALLLVLDPALMQASMYMRVFMGVFALWLMYNCRLLFVA